MLRRTLSGLRIGHAGRQALVQTFRCYASVADQSPGGLWKAENDKS